MGRDSVIKRFRLFRVFLRSFLIQGAWNFERMQNIGFAFSLVPALKGMGRESLARHLGFFNTHPYMASPIIGAVIRMEEEGRDKERIESLKKALMGPYGAMGDSFFWGAWRPFSSVVALLFTARYWNAWGPALFLLLYNIPHLWIRWRGLIEGYKTGEDVVHYVERWNMPIWVRRIRYLILILLGLFLVSLLRKADTGRDIISFVPIPGALILVLLTSYLVGKGFVPVKIVYLYSILWIFGVLLFF